MKTESQAKKKLKKWIQWGYLFFSKLFDGQINLMTMKSEIYMIIQRPKHKATFGNIS